MRWLRLHSDLLDDPKQMQMDDKIFRTFIKLLCFAAETNENGIIKFSEKKTAWRLRTTEKTLKKSVDSLCELGILVRENGYIRFINWEKRQFRSDCSTERVKRFRNALRNVPETPPDTDSDSDTEKTIYRTLTGTPPNASASGDSRKRKTPHVYSKDFERAWDNHGRKDGSKFKAEKTWMQLKRSGQLPDLQVILDAQDKQKQSRKWMDGYCPYFQTWLNGRLWEETIQDGDEWGEVEDFR